MVLRFKRIGLGVKPRCSQPLDNDLRCLAAMCASWPGASEAVAVDRSRGTTTSSSVMVLPRYVVERLGACDVAALGATSEPFSPCRAMQ
jgi:hypothetical protein